MNTTAPNAGLNPAQRRYYQAVKARLKCSHSFKKQVLASLRRSMAETPDADLAELEARFGTPEQFAQNIMENLEPEQFSKAHPGKLRAWIAAAILLVALLLGTLLYIRLTTGPLLYIVHEKTTIIDLGEGEWTLDNMPTPPPLD